MKKHLLLAGLLLLTAISFGQKKEIKKAEKAISSGDYSEAMSYINQAQGLIGNADQDMKAQFYIVKATALMESAGADINKLKLASEALNMAKEVGAKGKNASRMNESMDILKGKFESSAQADYKAQNYMVAAEKYYTAYTMNAKDTLFLFNAALSAKNANDFESAENYFLKLDEIGYTGIQKQFVATNKATGEVESFGSKVNRDLSVKAGTYVKPDIMVTESKKELILLSLAQISSEKGDSKRAIELIEQVRKDKPDDLNLIQVEADMVYKNGDMERYNELMQEMIAISPDNPDLYNNLGVASAKLGMREKAIEYYTKAIELKPDNAGAMINIAVLMLGEEAKMNEEMNSLGTSRADYARYDELKAQKNEMYKEAMPYLESALEHRSDNVEIVRTLMGIYSQLGMDDKFNGMKSRLQEMEGGQ